MYVFLCRKHLAFFINLSLYLPNSRKPFKTLALCQLIHALLTFEVTALSGTISLESPPELCHFYLILSKVTTSIQGLCFIHVEDQ